MAGALELGTKLIDAFNALDSDALASILADNAQHTNFGQHFVGRAAIVDYFKHQVFPKFTALTFTAVRTYEDRDKEAAILEWTSDVLAETGKKYANSGVFIVTAANGHIATIIEYYDTSKTRQNVM